MTGDSTAEITTPSPGSRWAAEAFGTFLLVFAVIGTALFASHLADADNAFAPGIAYIAVALAVGLSVLVGWYAFAPISGGHFNPAVTLGLAAAGRFAWRDVVGYIVAQIVGGAAATTAIVLIGLFGPDGWLAAAQDGGFASNGWGEHSPSGFGLPAVIVAEVIATAFFLLVILGVTHPRRGTPFAGIAIGLTLTVLYLPLIPVDNASINPARSIAAALYGGGLGQVWAFIVFPILGAMCAGFAYRALFDNAQKTPVA